MSTKFWGLKDHNGTIVEYSGYDLRLHASLIFEAIQSHSYDLPNWWLNNEQLYENGPGSPHFHERVYVYHRVPVYQYELYYSFEEDE
jgi:hypothetical protein